MQPSPEICQEAAGIKNNSFLNYLHIFQALLSGFSCLTIVYLFWSMGSRFYGIFNANLKCLLMIGAMYIAINSCTSFMLYSYLLVIKNNFQIKLPLLLFFQITNHIQFPDCFYAWPTLHCMPIRFTTHYTSIGFSALHFIILLERTYTILKKEEEEDKFDLVGKILSVVAVFL